MSKEVSLTKLPRYIDDRGKLLFMEGNRHVPFPIRRLFLLYDATPGIQRGDHAHRECEQFLIAFSGRFTAQLDDGRSCRQYVLSDPTDGLHVPPMNWLLLRDIAPGTVCCVLASHVYDPADYIREYEAFLSAVAEKVS
jgi:WxcM-like, C-terminal